MPESLGVDVDNVNEFETPAMQPSAWADVPSSLMLTPTDRKPLPEGGERKALQDGGTNTITTRSSRARSALILLSSEQLRST